jgi:hypothetical protein
MIRSWWQRFINLLAALFRRGSTSAAPFSEKGGIVAFQLLLREPVRQELDLNPGQTSQILKLTRQARQRRRRQQARRNQRPRRQAAAKEGRARAIAAEVLADLDRAGVLTPEQKSRLRQLVWQQQNVAAFADPVVQEALKLTPDQQKAARSSLVEMRQQVRAHRDNSDEAAEEAPETIRKAALDRILGLLDEEQKHRWEQLKGRPFALAEETASSEEEEAESDEPAPPGPV